MGNWKKRNAAKRARGKDEDRGDNPEAEILRHDRVIERLDLSQAALMQSGGAREICPCCRRSVSLFCPHCLTVSESLQIPKVDFHGGGSGVISWENECDTYKETVEFEMSAGATTTTTSSVRPPPTVPGHRRFSRFPLKVHIISHPSEKPQKSSATPLPLLCDDYAGAIGKLVALPKVDHGRNIGEEDADEELKLAEQAPGGGDRIALADSSVESPQPLNLHFSATSRRINEAPTTKPQQFAESMPWLTTSVLSSEEVEGDERTGESAASTSGRTSKKHRPPLTIFEDTKDFLTRVDPRDCVLLCPGGASVREVFGFGRSSAGVERSEGGEDSVVGNHDQHEGDQPERPRTDKAKNLHGSELLQPPPKVAVFLDCSWSQVEPILEKHPELREMRRMSITSRSTMFWRHHGRQGRGDQGLSKEHLSTAEAVFWTLFEVEQELLKKVKKSSTAGRGAEADQTTSSEDDTSSNDLLQQRTGPQLLNAVAESRFLPVLFFFLAQYLRIQQEYRARGRNFAHLRNYIVGVELPDNGSAAQNNDELYPEDKNELPCSLRGSRDKVATSDVVADRTSKKQRR